MKMEGVQAVEGELNAIVKEYMQMLNYNHSVKKFEDETEQNDKKIILESLPPTLDENQMRIQNVILQAFDNGNSQAFTRLWSEHIPENLQVESSCQRLEFNIQLYFAVFPIRQDASEQSKADKAMKSFKAFLETRGASLSQTTEFVTFYALPFVPAVSLKSHPSFSVLFEESWSDDLRQKLGDFLSTVLYSSPVPYLYKLYIGSNDRSKTEVRQYENHIEALQQQISEHEHRATQYFKRYTKIQADYRNLINIAAELVDALENAVRGKMVTPEYLREICERLFKNGQNPIKSTTDFARPGTASSMLRASVNNFTGVAIGNDVPYLPSLNYGKIKEDLRRITTRKKALLLQALRLRLVKASSGEQRDAAVSSYVANDILGCSSDIKHAETMVNLLNSKEEILRNQTAMFFNTVASFTAGRAYIGQSEPMVKEIISRLKKESEKTVCGENLLGTMQKLSLRRQVQTIMTDCDLVQWLIMVLEEPESLSDYTLEYSVALLMNLCLRSTGKKKCLKNCENILKLLADLLGHENKEIRPYVNGTLYSILALATIRQKAVSMGLEEVLRCYLQDDDDDTNRQINFIVKQMNTNDSSLSDDPYSDAEDEDDDEEGDVVDAELDEDETEIAKPGELSSEQLLSAHYLGVLSSLSFPKGSTEKAVSDSLDNNQEMPLTRPVTPRGQPKLNSIQERLSRETERSDLHSRSERPKTQSSGSQSRRNQGRESGMSEGSRPPSSRERPVSNRGIKKLDPFQTKPKIPRTPDVGSGSSTPLAGSRPTSANAPPPTKSVSPPLPRPSSKGQDPLNCLQPCKNACNNFSGRHYHCQACQYASARLDNFKRHIKYHISSNSKERQKTPECMKELCNEYFTTKCDLESCRHRDKAPIHFHCSLCKFSCTNKKSFRHRLGHLRSRHYLFFKDLHQLEDLSDPKVQKRMRRLSILGIAKFLPGKCKHEKQEDSPEENMEQESDKTKEQESEKSTGGIEHNERIDDGIPVLETPMLCSENTTGGERNEETDCNAVSSNQDRDILLDELNVTQELIETKSTVIGEGGTENRSEVGIPVLNNQNWDILLDALEMMPEVNENDTTGGTVDSEQNDDGNPMPNNFSDLAFDALERTPDDISYINGYTIGRTVDTEQSDDKHPVPKSISDFLLNALEKTPDVVEKTNPDMDGTEDIEQCDNSFPLAIDRNGNMLLDVIKMTSQGATDEAVNQCEDGVPVSNYVYNMLMNIHKMTQKIIENERLVAEDNISISQNQNGLPVSIKQTGDLLLDAFKMTQELIGNAKHTAGGKVNMQQCVNGLPVSSNQIGDILLDALTVTPELTEVINQSTNSLFKVNNNHEGLKTSQ